MQTQMTGGNAAPPLEKRSPKDTRKILVRLSKLVFRWKKQCIILIITILITLACQLTVPILVQKAINALIYRDSADFVKVITGILTALVVVFVLNSLIEYIKNLSAMRLSENLSLYMRKELFERTVHAPLSYLDTHSYGDMMSRLTNDSQRVSTVAQVLEEFTSKIIVIIGCGIIMILESWKLAMISIITAIITTIISGIISGKMRGLFMKQTISLGAMNGHLEESIKNYRTMELAGIRDYTSGRMREKSKEYTDVCIKSSMFSAIINPIMLILGNLSFMITVVVGGHYAIDKVITVGVLQAVIMYSKQFMDSVYGFGNVMIQTQSFLASAERVFEVIDIKIEDSGTASKLVKQGDEAVQDVADGVVFKDVSFSYDGERDVLKDINISLTSGEVTALVGATGAGKTTLINLMLKFYDNYRGEIYINKKNIKDLPLSEVRQLVTVVLQDSRLVEGTVLDNIIYGMDADEGDEASDRELVEDVLKVMGVRDIFSRLPNDLDTETNDDDETISEGMRQIIGLARAIVRKPKLLVLDEALCSVDKETETMIRENVRKRMGDVTSITIAHRLDTTEDADRIIVLKDGAVVEEGTKNELLKAGKEYYRLYMSQQQGREI